jgi:hypothetical protein
MKGSIGNMNQPDSAGRPTADKDGLLVAAEEVRSEAGKSGISFPVDSVTPAEKPIWTETLADSLSRRFLRKILVLPERQQQVINASIDFLRERFPEQADIFCPVSRCHPLIDAVHVAFSQHRPLALSPDDIWLVIAQGFSHHVAENAEALRYRLVRHQGSRELSVKVTDLRLASFEDATASFSRQIQLASDPVLHETLICDFSTTTSAIRTASEVVLMDSFSSYFTYVMRCLCGIPRITIEGTPDDWQRIRARIEVIETYGLEWWVPRLRPILDEFVLAAEGHPTQKFWQAIYKPAQAYGAEVATGWITDLFPYLGDAPDRRRNPVLQHDRHDWALPVEKGVETRNFFFDSSSGKGVSLKSFPSGISSVPVNVHFNNGSPSDVDLVAGFFGVRQDPNSWTLSPVIGWSITEPAPKTPIEI